MNPKKNYETKLPDNYVLVKTVDANSNKMAIYLTLAATLLWVAVFVVAWLAVFGTQSVSGILDELLSVAYTQTILRLVILFVSIVAYMVLHELVHGVVYKLFTRQKLTFGLTLTVAFCGVPTVYVYRKVALAALLAPFAVFSVAFLLPMIFVKDTAVLILFVFLFSMHFGGCVGDLYDAALYLFVMCDKDILMRDTGPKQSFFVPAQSALGEKVLQDNPDAVENTRLQEEKALAEDSEKLHKGKKTRKLAEKSAPQDEMSQQLQNDSGLDSVENAEANESGEKSDTESVNDPSDK